MKRTPVTRSSRRQVKQKNKSFIRTIISFVSFFSNFHFWRVAMLSCNCNFFPSFMFVFVSRKSVNTWTYYMHRVLFSFGFICFVLTAQAIRSFAGIVTTPWLTRPAVRMIIIIMTSRLPDRHKVSGAGHTSFFWFLYQRKNKTCILFRLRISLVRWNFMKIISTVASRKEPWRLVLVFVWPWFICILNGQHFEEKELGNQSK